MSGTDSGGTPSEDSSGGKGRRNFLKLALTLGGVVTLASLANLFRLLAYVPPASVGGTTGGNGSSGPAWPRVKIANLASLDPSKLVRFNYPLVDTPNVLIKAGQKAENGVGPNSDIVAFSNLCQHLGCFYAVVLPGESPACNSSLKAASPEGYCCCHGGQYDLLRSAAVIGGPPPRSLPQVTLEYDQHTGDIYAVGMGSPSIFGHGPPGTTDPAQVLQNDLAGGDLVTQATVFSGI